VAVAGGTLVVSASETARPAEALYRRASATTPFRHVTDWIEGNVDTALGALDDRVVRNSG
jgi:hypothetical protein